ncbi:hypothetical protein C1645_515470 [Glomus cerebriforme]|uniref:Uncharacterized protein n=1 Tax=Glomus cerebriforme TaxID=658196 RepID=A0A397T9R9_9GLOM|nr:hypothetical protein C1645_515470 [Glomus cerebriforme]
MDRNVQHAYLKYLSIYLFIYLFMFSNISRRNMRGIFVKSLSCTYISIWNSFFFLSIILCIFSSNLFTLYYCLLYNKFHP